MRFTTALVLLAAGLLIAGCSAAPEPQVASLGGGAGQPMASETPGADAPDGGLAFARCMRDNGVDLPDPDPDGGLGGGPPPELPRGSEQFQAAIEACQDLRPAGGPGDRTFDEAAQEAALELARCLRSAGLDFPDPQFDAEGRRVMEGEPNRAQFQDPGSRDVMQTCREETGLEFPGGGPGAQVGPAGAA